MAITGYNNAGLTAYAAGEAVSRVSANSVKADFFSDAEFPGFIQSSHILQEKMLPGVRLLRVIFLVLPINKFSIDLLHPAGCTFVKKCFQLTILGLLLHLYFSTADAQITQVAGSPQTATTTTTTLTIPKPSGLALNDVMLANIVQSDNDNQTLSNAVSSGWTIIDGRVIGTSGSDDWWGTVLYKVANAADVAAASFTFTLDNDANGDGSAGAIVAFRGVHVNGGFNENGVAASGPFDVDPGIINVAGDVSAVTATTTTTNTANAAVVMFAQYANDRTIGSWACTNPGALNELYDLPFNTQLDNGIGAAWSLRTTPGVTGNGTAILSGNARNGGLLVTLRPLLPAIAGFTPSTGCANSTAVTITGTNLSNVTSVSFGGVPASSFTINSATEITATPAGGSTGVVAVANGAGSASSAAIFTVNPLPGQFSVTGGGNACSNGSGVAVGLSGSAAGINYQLFRGATPLNTVAGTGGTISFGAQAVAGTYTVVATHAVTGCARTMTGSVTVSITPLSAADFSYTASPYCSNSVNPLPDFVGPAIAGTFSAAPSGLVFTSTSTGKINLAASTAGTYTVTNTIAASGGCPVVIFSGNVTILAAPIASIAYGGSPYCATAPGSFPVTQTGTAGGTYSSLPGLSLDPVTGAIIPAASTPGTYTVTYTFSDGACSNTTTTDVTISLPAVTCPSNAGACITAPAFSLTGGSPAGGTYSGTGVSGGVFNPAAAGLGVHTITYTYTNPGGCTNSCSYLMSVTNVPDVTATPASVFIYSGTSTSISLSSAVPGTLYTWTASANSSSVSGFSNQPTPATGPIVQQLFNSSSTLGEVTYTITPVLNGCSGSPVTVVISIPNTTFCENPGFFLPGSCIINMGVTPQTEANGLKPYGLLYQLLNVNRVPVYWCINPNKDFVSPVTKVDQADFTVDGINFRGGSFVIPAAYVPQVQSVINAWVAQGVVVHYSTVSFSAPVYELLTNMPKVVLDAQTGNLIETAFYLKAGIPVTAYTKGGIPSNIANCDDVYVLPHADPQNWSQQQKDSLLNFINVRGWLFAACHAVSAIESIPGMNFLSNSGLVLWTNHSDPTTPYNYSVTPGAEAARTASDPFMQFVGTLDGALTSGSERIYVPITGWRATTKVAVYDSNYVNTDPTPDVVYPNTAAALVYGRAFGNPDRGMIMYMAGHNFLNGTEAEDVAAARVYANFLLRSGVGSRPKIIPVTIPTTAFAGQTVTFSVNVPPSTSAIVSYEWTSDIDGIFSNPNGTTTSFNVPAVNAIINATIQFKVTDVCGRVALYCTTLTINPTITNNHIAASQLVCSGVVPADLAGTVPVVAPGNPVSYLWLSSTTGSATGFAPAPGANNGKNYTPQALTQTTWFRREVTSNAVTVVSASIQISVKPSPSVTASATLTTLCTGQSTSLSSEGVGAGVNTATLSLSSTQDRSIPDNSSAGVRDTITVSGAPATMGLLTSISVTVNLTHTRDQHVELYLIRPGGNVSNTANGTFMNSIIPGQSIALVADRGADGDHFTNTVFSDVAIQPISAGTAPFTGNFRPENAFSTLTGNPNGDWVLKAVDDQDATTGILTDWTLTMTYLDGVSYSWTSSPAGFTSSLQNPGTVTPTVSTTYTVLVTEPGNTCTASAAVPVTVNPGGTWLGVDNNWFNAANWCNGIVPGSTTDVLIPNSVPNYPLINTGTASAKNLTIQNASSVTVSNARLQIAGAVSNSGILDAVAGEIELNAAVAPQSISGSMFKSRMVASLIISAPGGVSISSALNDTLHILDSLAFGNVNNATLNTGDNLCLVSRALRTARIADISNGGVNSGNAISGKVTVERYIPPARSWRLMTVPLAAAGAPSFNSAWQEGVVNSDYVYANNQNPRPGFGMHISGSSPVLGFDPTPQNNPSVKYYDPATGAWPGIPNTLTAKPTDSSGYMVFVRGNRSTQLFLNTAAVPSPAILRTTGQVKTNAQTVLLPGGAGAYAVAGNPYASAIDLRKLQTSGGVDGVNLAVWDPALTGTNGVGAFQYLTRTGGPGSDYIVFPGNTAPGGGSYGPAFGVYNRLESGQAMMVQKSGQGAVLFSEQAKMSGSSSAVFRPMAPVAPFDHYISTRLYYETGDASQEKQLVDGALVIFNNAFADTVDALDARKLQNFSSENFGLSKNNQWLQIERRGMPRASDTLRFLARSYRVRKYWLQIDAKGMNQAGVMPFLEDQYLGSLVPLNMEGPSEYPFSVTLDSGAWHPLRFRIVFRPVTALPVQKLEIAAKRFHDAIRVSWKVEAESGIQRYWVERSVDGRLFVPAHTEENIFNNGASCQYQWLDTALCNGMVFYRVKGLSFDAQIQYSKVINLQGLQGSGDISLATNPVTGGSFALQYSRMEPGIYRVSLFSAEGALVDAGELVLPARQGNARFRLNKALSAGHYLLEVESPKRGRWVIRAVYQP